MSHILHHGDHNRLKKDSLGLQQILASSLANIAPAMSFYFGFSAIVMGAGLASPLTILVATVAVLFLANTLAQFTIYRPSAGSFVTFTGMAFGGAVGSSVSVFVVAGYITAAAGVVAISGGWFIDTVHLFFGISAPWVIFALLFSVLVGWLVMRGISLSTFWAALFFYFEFSLLLAGAIFILIVNRHFINWAPFDPRNLADGWKGIGLGFPLAIYMFVGWENSAMLAEETKDPRKNIPKALYGSTLAIGIFYIFLAYAVSVGFHGDTSAMIASPIPFIGAIDHYSRIFVIVAYLAGLTSVMSSLIGLTNGQARILFNSGREGLLPKFFGRAHPKYKTPWIATWTFLALAGAGLVITFLFSGISALSFYVDAGGLGTIAIIIVYIITNLALPVYMLRYHKNEVKLFRHIVVPLVGVIAMGFPLWLLIEPGQPAPFDILPWVAFAALIISVIYGFILKKIKPSISETLGSYVADK